MPKVGIRYAYPHVPLGVKTRGLVQAVRPFTLAAPLIGVASAVGMAVQYGYATHATLVADRVQLVLGTLALFLATVGSNLMNQATDHVEDALTKPWRPIPRGILIPMEAKVLAIVAWVLACWLSMAAPVAFFLLLVLIIGTSWAYSSDPLRLKRRLYLGNVAIATARGLLGLPAAFALVGPVTAPQPWAAAGVLFLFIAGASTAKDFADARGDRAAGVRNLVTHYGRAGAKIVSTPFVFSPLLTLLIAKAQFGLDYNPVALALADVVLLVFLWKFYSDGAGPNRLLEGSKSWAHSYYVIFALFVLFGLNGLVRLFG